MFSKNRNISLRGGALYYVIFVVFVLTAITTFYMMHRGAKVVQVRQELEYFTCVDDMNSALTLYLSAPDRYQNKAINSLPLFGDTSRRVQITQKPYGLLDLITAETNYRGKILSKTLLAGKDPYQSDSVALYVPDRQQILYASGKSSIQGNAVLPAKGIQSASIEGKPLQLAQPVSGSLSPSGDSLPSLAPSVIEKLNLIQNLDSLCSGATPISELYQASITNALSENIHWYGSDDDFQISGFEAKGGVGFCSSGTILIQKDAILRGTLVTASRIIVEDGFCGEVQLFAQDSLVIGKECLLRFPSVVCLSSNNVSNLHMEIKENSSIEGTVLVYQPQLAAQKPFLAVKEGVLIVGQVYHQGKINLLGTIHGSLYCETFYLKTDRAHYENHLLDNEIDFLKLPRLFVSIDLMHGYHDQIIDVVGQKL